MAPADEDLSDPELHKLAPTLITGVSEAMRISQEEIFGPVLPIVTYGSLDEAIGYINAAPMGAGRGTLTAAPASALADRYGTRITRGTWPVWARKASSDAWPMTTVAVLRSGWPWILSAAHTASSMINSTRWSRSLTTAKRAWCCIARRSRKA
ncbi:aldehyde dehydrogenase family protein [Duganella sp.]|uniref:aldehyde dehydrogenase family protein n=1 Tax=Duganella sp. TaxID=1904440 RepID=UPI0039C8AACF